MREEDGASVRWEGEDVSERKRMCKTGRGECVREEGGENVSERKRMYKRERGRGR